MGSSLWGLRNLEAAEMTRLTEGGGMGKNLIIYERIGMMYVFQIRALSMNGEDLGAY